MLTTNEPNVDFTLALGTDTFVDLASGKWRRTAEVFKLVGHRMIVFRRHSVHDGAAEEDIIQQHIAKWQIFNGTTPSIRLVEIPSLADVSSSIVRSTNDESILNDMVTPPILEYMKQNKLYTFEEGGR
jgi:nicotinic acid mononucleotide adenylyltransferase